MAMFHENHPDKDYEMANRVEYFHPQDYLERSLQHLTDLVADAR